MATYPVSGVYSLLITAPDEHLQRYHLAVCALLNPIERRGQTVFYTCLSDDYGTAANAADTHDVTLQELVIENGLETYPVKILGSHQMQWVRPSARS